MRVVRLQDEELASTVAPLSACDSDDELLEKVAQVLDRAERTSISSLLTLDKIHELHSEHVTMDDEDVCYVLESDVNGKMYFMCSNEPLDNDNLICEQQADGMDWICEHRHA
jgi:hypothetical protein